MSGKKTILVTGGAGFIGSNFIIHSLLKRDDIKIVNLDVLTYAGNLDNLARIENDERYSFVEGDIRNRNLVATILSEYKPYGVFHFAAESHVDRSIDCPDNFIATNITGTYILLECSYRYWYSLRSTSPNSFKFIHISTDEVFGTLGSTGYFTENSSYSPRSPYSASKASSNHIVASYFHTYGFPAIVTNCSNNYGPYQFPEKLIPLVIGKCLNNERIPVYGDGRHVRDWLYVEDHCRALWTVFEKGKKGETYNIGGNNEKTNLEMVTAVCRMLDGLMPSKEHSLYTELIAFVQDRPGHDRRYAIDATKIRQELGWYPEENIQSGIQKTVAWYLENSSWLERINRRVYHGDRLGKIDE